MRKVQTWISLIILTTTFSLTTSCRSFEKETDRVERVVVSYDQSRPLPQNSGIKVNITEMSQGLLFQPGQEPEFVLVAPGTYALLGVEVYRRLYALVEAIKVVQESFTPEQKAAFKKAQQEALLDLNSEISR